LTLGHFCGFNLYRFNEVYLYQDYGILPMSATAPAATTAIPAWLDLVRRKVEALRFGQVYIVVHDHQVTQIDCRPERPEVIKPSAQAPPV
jgi:hypothetical protein